MRSEPREASQRPFHETNPGSERSFFRRAIQKTGELTRAQKDSLTVLLNLWFYHRAKGLMHPGVEKIARRSRLSNRAIRSHLKLYREKGVLVTLALAEGGAGATRYRMDLQALMDWLAPCDVVERDGQLVEIAKSPETPSTVGETGSPTPAPRSAGINRIIGQVANRPWYVRLRLASHIAPSQPSRPLNRSASPIQGEIRTSGIALRPPPRADGIELEHNVPEDAPDWLNQAFAPISTWTEGIAYA